jgi:hypothetical protein
MTAFSLRPQRKADDDEGKAKQQADHHEAPITALKAEDSFCSPGTNRGWVFRRRYSLKILLPCRFSTHSPDEVGLTEPSLARASRADVEPF